MKYPHPFPLWHQQLQGKLECGENLKKRTTFSFLCGFRTSAATSETVNRVVKKKNVRGGVAGHGGGQDKREFGASSKADMEAVSDNFGNSEKAVSSPIVREDFHRQAV